MNFEEQVSSFMDMALSPGEEEEFLHILSVSPDKREVFHSYLGTHAAFVADLRSTTVPARLDAVVLGGIASSSILTNTPTSPEIWWTRSRIVSGIIAGIILFAGGYFSGSLFESHGAAPLPESSAVPFPSARNLRDQEMPSSGQSGSSEPGDAGQPGTRTIYVYKTDTVFQMRPPLTRIEYRERVAHDTLTGEREIRIPVDKPLVAESKSLPFEMTPPVLKHFEVSLQREHVTTFPYVDYRRLETERVQQNYSLSVAYNFNKHHAAGLTIGRKPFAQEYYSVGSDSIYLYQQQPVLNYGAAFYRLSLPISDMFIPQIGVSIGASDVGPLLGSQLTIGISPLRPVTMYIGTNASILLYRYKEKLFTSHTLGLLYGLNVQF